MKHDTFPAVARLKHPALQEGRPLQTLLAQLLADKGIDDTTRRALAHQSPQILGTVFGHLLMRVPDPLTQGPLLQQCLAQAALPAPQYLGTREENAQSDAGWEHQTQEQGLRSVTWRGAAGAYESTQIQIPAHIGRATRVVIIGAGAAGILVARALVDVGFTNILLLDQTGQIGGVWSHERLTRGSRANPFPLQFEDCVLQAAPGSGRAVLQWLHAIAACGARPFPQITQARVLAVRPGDLCHQVVYEDAWGTRHQITAPLIVNAMGAGEPLPPSRPGVMTTDISPQECGWRWQEIWTPEQAQRLHGRSLVFISLSNSTLEMIKQIQRYQREGLALSYTILTHYPEAALQDPQTGVIHQDRTMRLYRDPTRVRLLRLAGDLPEVAAAFEEARDTGCIVSHVTHWSREQGQQIRAVREDGSMVQIPCDELYTLIGYGPRAEQLRELGLSVNHPYLGAVDLDYDSEVQRETGVAGRSRLWPGYFCLGIRNAFNMNEVLLPGLLFRLPDLVAGVILRALEYAARRQ